MYELELCPARPRGGAGVRWEGQEGHGPARCLGAVREMRALPPALSGWLNLPALLPFRLPVGQVPAYTTGHLLAENNKGWYTWARRTEQQETEILRKISSDVYPKFVMQRFCTTGKLGLCILVCTSNHSPSA